MAFYLPNNGWRQVATNVGLVSIKAIGAVRVHFGAEPSGSEGTIYAYRTRVKFTEVDGNNQAMWVKSHDLGEAGLDGARSAIWVEGVGSFTSDDVLPSERVPLNSVIASGITSIDVDGEIISWVNSIPVEDVTVRGNVVGFSADPGTVSFSTVYTNGKNGLMVQPTAILHNSDQSYDDSAANFVTPSVTTVAPFTSGQETAIKFISLDPQPANLRDGLAEKQIGVVKLASRPGANDLMPSVVSWSGRTYDGGTETIDVSALLASRDIAVGGPLSITGMPPYSDLAAAFIQPDFISGQITRAVSTSIEYLAPNGLGGDLTNDGEEKHRLIALAALGIMSNAYTTTQREELLAHMIEMGKHMFDPLDSLVNLGTGAGVLVNGQIWRHPAWYMLTYLHAAGRTSDLAAFKTRLGGNQLRQPTRITPEIAEEVAPHSNTKAIASSYQRTLTIDGSDGAGIVRISRKDFAGVDQDDGYYIILTGMDMVNQDGDRTTVTGRGPDNGAPYSGDTSVTRIEVADVSAFSTGDTIHFEPSFTVEEGSTFWNLWDDKLRGRATMYLSTDAAYIDGNRDAMFNLFFRWLGAWRNEWKATEDLAVLRDDVNWPTPSDPVGTSFDDAISLNGTSYDLGPTFGTDHAATLRALPAAAWVPEFFTQADWSLSGDQVTITALPDDNGSALTAIEWSEDGSTWSTLTSSPAAGTFTATGVSGAIYLRAVNAVGSGPRSHSSDYGASAVNLLLSNDNFPNGLIASDYAAVNCSVDDSVPSITWGAGTAVNDGIFTLGVRNATHVLPLTPDLTTTVTVTPTSVTAAGQIEAQILIYDASNALLASEKVSNQDMIVGTPVVVTLVAPTGTVYARIRVRADTANLEATATVSVEQA